MYTIRFFISREIPKRIVNSRVPLVFTTRHEASIMPLISTLSTILLAVALLPFIWNIPLNDQLDSTSQPIEKTNGAPTESDFDRRHVYHAGYRAQTYVDQFPKKQLPKMIQVFLEKPQFADWQGDAKTGWKPKKDVSLNIIYTPRLTGETSYRCKSFTTKEVVICFNKQKIAYQLVEVKFDESQFKDPKYQQTGRNTCAKVCNFCATGSALDDAWFANHSTNAQSVQFGSPSDGDVCGSQLSEELTSTSESVQNTNVGPLDRSDFDEKHVYYSGYGARMYVNRYPKNQMPIMVTVFDKKPKFEHWEKKDNTKYTPKKAVDLFIIYTRQVDTETLYRCKATTTKGVEIGFDNRHNPFHVYKTDFDARQFQNPTYYNTGGNNCAKICDFCRVASLLLNETYHDAVNNGYHRQLDDAWFMNNDDTDAQPVQ